MLTEVQKLVVQELRSLRETLIDNGALGNTLTDDPSPAEFPRSEMAQMVEGVFTAAEEFFNGGSRPFWDTYMQTVIPGLLAAGYTLPALLHRVASFYCLATADLDTRLRDRPERIQARNQFVRFSAAWVQAVASAA